MKIEMSDIKDVMLGDFIEIESSPSIEYLWLKMFKESNVEYDEINMTFRLIASKDEVLKKIDEEILICDKYLLEDVYEKNSYELSRIKDLISHKNNTYVVIDLWDIFYSSKLSYNDFYRRLILNIESEEIYKSKTISEVHELKNNVVIHKEVTKTQVKTSEEYFKTYRKKYKKEYSVFSVTNVLIVLNVLMYLMFNVLDFNIPPQYILHGIENVSNFNLTRIASIFVSGFMHASIAHIIFNMTFLLSLGIVLEKRIGKINFLIVYLVSMFVSGLVVMFTVSPIVFTVGASGALYGIFGFLLLYFHFQKTHIDKANFNSLLGSLVLNLIYTFTIPNISIAGHIGGLVAGILIALIYRALDKI